MLVFYDIFMVAEKWISRNSFVHRTDCWQPVICALNYASLVMRTHPKALAMGAYFHKYRYNRNKALHLGEWIKGSMCP